MSNVSCIPMARTPVVLDFDRHGNLVVNESDDAPPAPPNTGGDARSHRIRARKSFARARRARELGYDELSAGHEREGRSFQALAAYTANNEIGGYLDLDAGMPVANCACDMSEVEGPPTINWQEEYDNQRAGVKGTKTAFDAFGPVVSPDMGGMPESTLPISEGLLRKVLHQLNLDDQRGDSDPQYRAEVERLRDLLSDAHQNERARHMYDSSSAWDGDTDMLTPPEPSVPYGSPGLDR